MSTGELAPSPGRRLTPALTAALLMACTAGLAGLALKATHLNNPLPEVQPGPAHLREGVRGAGAEHGAPGSRPVTDPTDPADPAGPAAPVTQTAAPVAPGMALASKADKAAQAAQAEPPYRFIGQTAAGEGEVSVVLFGRGRVVTLQGPGPVDDEYVVEALFDTYLVLRHTPSGSGHFLPLVSRHKPFVSTQDPEQSARD